MTTPCNPGHIKQPKAIDDDVVPRVTYSHPELAAVGLTEKNASDKYGDTVRVAQHDLAGNAKIFLLGTGGSVKVITADNGRVVGVHMVGDRVG